MVDASDSGPAPLSDAQRREIDDAIAEARPVAGEPWFVFVHQYGNRGFRASAYFRPTEVRGRIRRGKAIVIDDKTATGRRLGAQLPGPQPYVQVSRGGSERAAPTEADLPFPPPQGLSDDDLALVIDAARFAAAKRDPAAALMPVDQVQLDRAGAITVFFGRIGTPNRPGVSVVLQREGPSFVTTSVSMWVR